MAQTWRITPGKVALFRAIDFLGYPFRRLLSPPPPAGGEIRNILVIESWYIGDVVLSTSILRALRGRFPGARITLLAKAHAEELLRHSGLADEVLVYDLPWTSKRRKYDPRRYDFRSLGELIRKLRDRHFDLSVDARMDIRSNLLAFLSGAPRRVGYAFGGGAFLLTDPVVAMPNLRHKVDDWLALMEPLKERDLTGPKQDATGVAEFDPLLKVTEEERSAAAAKLRANGIGEDDLLIGVHGGASDIRRRWPLDKFQNVAGALSAKCGAKVLFFLEPDAPERTSDVASVSMQTSLREMMALLTHCDLFLCNDSGPMHVADALGVPVVAVFLTGNPAWHRPFRRGQIVVGEGTGHDFLIAPQEHDVLIAAESVLARRRKALPTVFLPGGSPE